MTDYGDAIDEARLEVADAATEFMPDVCTIFAPGTPTKDSHGNTSTAETEIESDVPCSYRALGAYEVLRGGKESAAATHLLTLPVTDNTMAITEKYRILVAARGNTPALSFDIVGGLPESTGIMLTVQATVRG